MSPDTRLMTQIAPYQSWLIIAGVLVLFFFLRLTRRALRRRIDEIGYRLFRERGLLLWFWLNAPGVILHELSHALVVLLFSPFGFRITSITLFRIRPMNMSSANGRVVHRPQSLQLGEVQYVRPQGRIMSYIGDGFSGIAPLIGGTLAFIFLYWVATGYNLWDATFHTTSQQIQLVRSGWPWWTLLFAPYLILTVTSELWPSRQDWRGAGGLIITIALLVALLLIVTWYFHYTVTLLTIAVLISSHIDFALLVLLALDIVLLLLAQAVVIIMRS